MAVPESLMTRVGRLRAGQDGRIAAFHATARNFFRPMLRPDDAAWTIPLTTESGRLDLQLSVAFYESGDPADWVLADKLVQRAPIPCFPAGHRFDIFQTSIAIHLLARYDNGQRMDRETVQWCEAVTREGVPGTPGMMSPDYQFHGYNDNMPAMTCKTLILGGERLHEPAWVERGLQRLEQLAGLLSRRGLISEFNSPNYLPDTINAVDMIAEHAHHADARDLAQRLLKRLWLDAAVHWHPQGRAPTGPHSRAYGPDFLNHLSPMKALVWYTLGTEVSGITPMEACNPRKGLLLIHCGDTLEQTVRFVWYASSTYRSLPDATAALFVEKPDRFACSATAEVGDDGTHPVRKTVCTTWIRPAYSLGSSTVPFLGGEQTSSPYITIASRADIPPVAGVKYLVDANEPGNERTMNWHVARAGEDWVVSNGEMATVQHEASALVWAEPQLKLAGTAIERLRLAFILATAFEEPAELIIGGQPIATWQGSYPANQWIGIRLGDALIGLRPLAASASPDSPAQLVLRRNARHHWIEVVNYDGAKKVFTRADLLQMQNGLVLEVAAAADHPSLLAFIFALERSSRLQDCVFFRTRRMRYLREALADRDPVLLTITASIEHGSALVAANEVEPGGEPWSCTGIPAASLPFLAPGQALCSRRPFPWTDLSVHWFPGELWKIIESDRESRTGG